MPLPENNVPWPPPALAPQLADMAIDDAWYSGDKARLRRVYATEGLGNGRNERDSSGRPWRFWERPRPMGRRDNRLHVPLAADIAAKSAALLFSEPPKFTFEDDATKTRWDEITGEGGLNSTLREGAEVATALGGIALRATWNADLAKRPLITAVHADGVVPEWAFGVMTGITLWRELLREGDRVLRHLERHEPGKILHALFDGTSANLGIRVPLTEHPGTSDIAANLGEDGESIATGVTGLTCVYIPNMRPNRKYRSSMLGRSDWQDDGIRDLFMSLDETYTSWMRDIRLAKARLVAPSGYLNSEGLGKGVSFDDDREIWSPVNAGPTSNEGLTMVQFGIRVAEHEQSWRAFSRKAVESCGYSAQSFGLGDTTAITATEVISQERASMITRDQKGGYWLPGLADLADVVLQLDRVLGFSSVTPARPNIEFGDSVSEDPKTLAESIELLARAQAASTETKVRLRWPDWDDTRVKEETDRILKETGAMVADPAMTGAEGPGAPGFGDPAGGEEAD
ncbi:phage portal protein [Streptomyces sp. NBC_01565]|uniref:phage portal protein n=1 Tax=Streptomyces sp. NBC_01565 TaxID=2975881 RepID=UPI00225ABAD4|nr:phage portal protein [Streptomyces sp. NBC_01565]MCX4540489.1 phage portal protein [Streptomyces sp. NBC_01565]